MNATDSPEPPRAVAVIPARYNSTRLPGKPLVPIAGRPMVLHVLERAARARNVARALVATDDARIFDAVRAAGREAVMTSPDHASGSDRLAEVARALRDAEIVVNVQGDEPLIWPETVERVVEALGRDPEASVATACEPFASAKDVLSPDAVKAVVDGRGRALYFSRSPVPYPREAVRRHGSLKAVLEHDASLLSIFRKHTGLYAYRRDFLLEFSSWPQTPLELCESLEQLRMLERGALIRVVEASSPSVGVGTPEDLERVRPLVAARGEVSAGVFTR